MGTITKSVELDVEVCLTPTELAEMFWSMPSNEQAHFFGHLANLSGDKLAFQLQAVTDEPGLSDDARYLMHQIGQYSEKS